MLAGVRGGQLHEELEVGGEAAEMVLVNIAHDCGAFLDLGGPFRRLGWTLISEEYIGGFLLNGHANTYERKQDIFILE